MARQPDETKYIKTDKFQIADSRDTISFCLIQEALAEISRFGGDPRSLLSFTGLTPENLVEKDGRISVSLYAELWRRIALAIDDEFFGMNTRRMKTGSFTFISRSALTCKDIRRSIYRILKFFSITFDNMSAYLKEDDGLSIITLEDTPKPFRAFTYFTFWLLFDGLVCWLAGRRIPILAIDLVCAPPPPAHCADYRTLFTEELRFHQPQSRLIFEAHHLDLPIRRTKAELRDFLRSAPANILVRYQDPSGFSARIKHRLASQTFEEWPTLETIAKEFHISPATFHRRLDAEGKTFQQLKNSVRRDWAIRFLCETSDSIALIAERVGFADASSFFRAFRKWTGLNPGEYRARMGDGGTPAHDSDA